MGELNEWPNNQNIFSFEEGFKIKEKPGGPIPRLPTCYKC